MENADGIEVEAASIEGSGIRVVDFRASAVAADMRALYAANYVDNADETDILQVERAIFGGSIGKLCKVEPHTVIGAVLACQVADVGRIDCAESADL